MKKFNLGKLKVQSFVTNLERDLSQTVKGGSDTLYDPACQNSFGGPNSLCGTDKTLCEVGETTRCISEPAIQCGNSW